MTDSLQWDKVIHRYGIGYRTEMEISQGVLRIIGDLQPECRPALVGHDLGKHFYDPPLSYIFINNKNIKGWSEDTYFNDALTECELTFYRNEDNTLRFRYFIQLTHGYLIHGLTWVKSSKSVAYNSYAFHKAKDFVNRHFLHPENSAPCNFRKTFRILDSDSSRVGTMYNTVVRGPLPYPLRLHSETMEEIVTLMKDAYAFFRDNITTISNIINQSR